MIQWALIKIDRFSKKLITYNLLSRRDNKNLKTSLHISHQGASKHVSGDLEKSVLKFDPRSGHLTLTRYVRTLRLYREYVESKFKNGFPTHWGIWNKNPAGTQCKSKKVLDPPPTIRRHLNVGGPPGAEKRSLKQAHFWPPIARVRNIRFFLN